MYIANLRKKENNLNLNHNNSSSSRFGRGEAQRDDKETRRSGLCGLGSQGGAAGFHALTGAFAAIPIAQCAAYFCFPRQR